jgi:NAD(P)-dependent dehydrogenase (short-subunit alcohol dehydrogenase family)
MSMLADDAFQGKTAIVTGGGTGLGLEVSTKLGRRGATVVCLSRDTEHHGDLLARGEEHGFRVVSRALDVRDPSAVKTVVRGLAKELGGIDVLVNNAAGNFIRPALVLAPKAFATVIDIALNGVFTMSREVGRVMKDSGGAIVNISAPYAVTGKPGVVHSACAKAGVEAMTKTLAAEWAPYGIRVNAVSPGPFVSEGAADRLWPSEEIERKILEEIPLGRFGTAEEVADLVCLLAGPDTPWMTGTILLADGGWTLPEPLADPEAGKVDRRRITPRE